MHFCFDSLVLALVKLNPLQAKLPMEPALISGFRSVKRIRVLTLSRRVLIYRPRYKKGRTNNQVSTEPGSNLGPCGRKAEILPIASTLPAHLFPKHEIIISSKFFPCLLDHYLILNIKYHLLGFCSLRRQTFFIRTLFYLKCI